MTATDPVQAADLADLGNIPPLTPEENAEWEARERSARLRKGEVLAALAAVTDPTLRAVIDHHERHTKDGYSTAHCHGCDQGCSCDWPTWPCSTIITICERLGIDMTDMDGDRNLARWEADT